MDSGEKLNEELLPELIASLCVLLRLYHFC